MVTLKETIFKFRTNIAGSNSSIKLFKISKITFLFSRTLLFFLILSNILFAQIAFDVKTTMEEKSQLHIVKLAVINALEQSNWARVVEVKEDYSLWLTNLQRYNNYNSFKSEIDLDLRTPAMLTRGKHITGLRVSITFDTTGISKVHTSSDTLLNYLLVQGIRSSGLLEEFTALLSSSIPFGSYFVNSFIANVFAELNRQPTPMESYEANLLAAELIVELRKLFAK